MYFSSFPTDIIVFNANVIVFKNFLQKLMIQKIIKIFRTAHSSIRIWIYF